MGAERKLQQLLQSLEFDMIRKLGKYRLAKWFMQQFIDYNGDGDNNDGCSLKDFATYFIRKLRKTTAKFQEEEQEQEQVQIVPAVNFCDVSEPDTIRRLVAIYTILIDYNLATNLLHEIIFLLSLLNCAEQKPDFTIDDVIDVSENVDGMDPKRGGKHERKSMEDENEDEIDEVDMKQYIEKNIISEEEELTEQQSVEKEVKTTIATSSSISQYSAMNVISNSKTAIFFAMHAIVQQRDALGLLDLASLETLIDCERLKVLAPSLVDYLQGVSLRIAALDPQILQAPIAKKPENYKFTEFYDERMLHINLPNNSDGSTFKQVRNRFYAILGIWERNHTNPEWNFGNECNVKVRKIFDKTEDVRILWQLAQLFVTQLLEDDAVKPTQSLYHHPLEPLLQNYVRTKFCVSGNRCFYKDFIASVDSAVFLEQLQTALFKKLVDLYEFELTNDADNLGPDQLPEGIFLVKAMPELLVLAKFLGYVRTRWIAELSNDQITKRFRRYVMKVSENYEIMLTVPWVVQYLIMLRDAPLDRYCCRPLILALFDLFKALSSTGLAEADAPRVYDQPPNDALLLRCYMGCLLSNYERVAFLYYDYCQSELFNLGHRIDAGEYGENSEDENGIELDDHQQPSLAIDMFKTENREYEQVACALDEQLQSQLSNTTLQLYNSLLQRGITHIIMPVQQEFSHAVRTIRHTRFRSIFTLVIDFYVIMRQMIYQQWQTDIFIASDAFIERNYHRYMLGDIDDNQRIACLQVLKREVKNMLRDWSAAVLFRRDICRYRLRNTALELYMRNNNLL